MILKRGSKGSAVVTWQHKINAVASKIGITPLVADGDFGGKTDAATRKVQAWLGVTTDGIVGNQTRAAYDRKTGGAPVTARSSITQSKTSITQKTSTPSPPDMSFKAGTFRRMLRKGLQGEDVATWQGRLIGWVTVKPFPKRGYFGDQTLKYTKIAQGKLGVKADGIVGNKTIAAYNQKQAPKIALRLIPPTEAKRRQDLHKATIIHRDTGKVTPPLQKEWDRRYGTKEVREKQLEQHIEKGAAREELQMTKKEQAKEEKFRKMAEKEFPDEIRKERERLASAAAINTLAKAIHKRIIECQQRLGNL